MQLADMADSKSAAEKLEGSNPSIGTTRIIKAMNDKAAKEKALGYFKWIKSEISDSDWRDGLEAYDLRQILKNVKALAKMAIDEIEEL